MLDDFIREPEFNAERVAITGKHRALFKMSDIARFRGFIALRDGLVAVLPMAAISTILYIFLAISDLIAKPDLLNTIANMSGTASEEFLLDPSWFLAIPYITPYLTFCALIPVFFAVAFTFELCRKYKYSDALPLSLISGVVSFIAMYSPLFIKSKEQISILEFPYKFMMESPQFLSGGVFIALVVSVLNFMLYRFLAGKGAVSPLPVNVSDALQAGFRVVLPGVILTLAVLIVIFLVKEPFGHAVYHSTVWMTKSMSSIYSLIIIVILVQMFAFFGIQGASSVYSIFWVFLLSGSIDPPLWGPQSTDTGFATLSTVFFFVLIGGTGSTLGLNIAMIRAKSEQIRKLGNMTMIPSLMNANDLIIFGLPLAFNRHLLIPFFLVPLVNLGIAYAAFTAGFIPAPALFVPPYIPGPLGAFLACAGSFSAVVVSIVNILIGWAVYSYFLLPYDLKVRENEELPDEISNLSRPGF